MVRQILLTSLLFPTVLGAQSIWFEQRPHKSFEVEILKPVFDGDSNANLLTSAAFLNAQLPLSERLTLTIDLPITHRGFEEGIRFDSQTLIGNPFVGLTFQKPGAIPFAKLGLRLPVATDEGILAAIIGTRADFDRIEAFVPHGLNLFGQVTYYQKNESNVVMLIRAGISTLVKTGGPTSGTELMADFSGQLGYEGPRFTFLTGITGRILSADSEHADGTALHNQAGFSASMLVGRVRPGVLVRVLLNKSRNNDVDHVIGLSMKYYFGAGRI